MIKTTGEGTRSGRLDTSGVSEDWPGVGRTATAVTDTVDEIGIAIVAWNSVEKKRQGWNKRNDGRSVY